MSRLRDTYMEELLRELYAAQRRRLSMVPDWGAASSNDAIRMSDEQRVRLRRRIEEREEELLSPAARKALPLVSHALRSWAAVLHVGLPEIQAQSGDVLVVARRRLDYVGGAVRWLSLDDYEALRQRAITDEEIELLAYNARDPRWFLDDRRQWGRRLKIWRSRLVLIHPAREQVSVAIKASSDDAALFELLSQVGGRMPVAGR